jgi:hypothetical protein
MGREVRRVPENWIHPRDERGNLIPLDTGYKKSAEGFLKLAVNEGLQAAIDDYGQAPDKNKYMPEWPEEECTHYQMYETTSEGTPISPVMPTPESLAKWLADTGASAFGPMTSSYEEWLTVCNGTDAVSAVIIDGVLRPGVGL